MGEPGLKVGWLDSQASGKPERTAKFSGSFPSFAQRPPGIAAIHQHLAASGSSQATKLTVVSPTVAVGAEDQQSRIHS